MNPSSRGNDQSVPGRKGRHDQSIPMTKTKTKKRRRKRVRTDHHWWMMTMAVALDLLRCQPHRRSIPMPPLMVDVIDLTLDWWEDHRRWNGSNGLALKHHQWRLS